MSIHPKLVNKQFNSPIKLYSPQNVNEALHKQSQVLANGVVGIDFHNLAKPANLANSAVLRMLEEVESGRSQGVKRVTWPPPPEELDGSSGLESENSTLPPLQEPVYSHGPARGAVASPPTVRQAPASPKLGRRGVDFEPPKTTITLRETPPLRQEPAPVYQAQPVAASVQGGERMRGDQKWPPESYKQQAAAENAARIALAKGPACRPRKVKKDYSAFFAQHQLNSTYPGYKAPPGTQHYTEGTSDL